MTALLDAIRLRVSVPGRLLIEGLDCTIAAGDVVALLGGNGSGKSLLLRTLAGLRPPADGRVMLGGADIRVQPRIEVARRLGFLPQDPEAPPQGSVAETVLLGRFAHLGFWQQPGDADEARVAQALAQVDLLPLARRELASLSGGEQRRAAIARLLVQAPAVYLLDEPTNHLDPAQQIAVLRGMRELAGAGAAVVVSLHDPNLALRFANRIALLSGNGNVEVVATPALQPGHLESLYGLRYLESRVSAQRFMMPD